MQNRKVVIMMRIVRSGFIMLVMISGMHSVAFSQPAEAVHSTLGYVDSGAVWHSYDTTGAGIPTSGGSSGGAITAAPGALSAGALVDLGTGASPAANTVNSRLAMINTTLGSPFQAGGSIANTTFAATQAAASSLNATVVGTGTFAVQSAESGTWTVQPGNTPNTSPWLATQTPATSGGLSVVSNIVANNTTSVAIKASAGQLFGVDAYSISAATPVWIKIYNTAQGSTTCGSGTPIDRILIPATGVNGSGQIWHDTNGDAYSTAITYCVTTGIADNDTTAPATNTYVVNFHYK